MKSSKQRKHEVKAAYIWLITNVVSTAYTYSNHTELFDNHSKKPFSGLAIVITYLFVLCLGYFVWKGSSVAKVLLGIVIGMRIYKALVDFSQGRNLTSGFIPCLYSLFTWVALTTILVLLCLSFIPPKHQAGTELA